jgi:hypothetical protein
MRRLMFALALLASTEASAHCYSRWYYPWPQRCESSSSRPAIDRHGTKGRDAYAEAPPRIDPKIALPGLAQADLDGGGADEPTRARLLLRAALEAANGH